MLKFKLDLTTVEMIPFGCTLLTMVSLLLLLLYAQGSIHVVQYMFIYVQCTVYNVKCTLHTVQCKLQRFRIDLITKQYE